MLTILGESIGQVVRDYETKQVIEGSYRHTVGGISFKSAAMRLRGAVLVEEGEYEGNVFYTMRSLLSSAADVEQARALRTSLVDIDLSDF